MTTENKNIFRRVTDKVYGGLPMGWPVVILYAVGTALLTTAFLLIPIFENTSFYRVGVTLEAWVFFAVIIMTNCKKPLESALKTFVFFLISQPLIYLLQVPFSQMGWGLFMYYRYWFMWTLLTFPMAFVGWYIKKRNWLSLLILLPVVGFLTFTYADAFLFAAKHFPYMLITALFCLLQVVVYLYTFTGKWLQRALGFFVPLAAVLAFALFTPQLEMYTNVLLPGSPPISSAATVVNGNEDVALVTVGDNGTGFTMLNVEAHQYGSTDVQVTDGDKHYNFTLEIYEDDTGHSQTRVIVPNENISLDTVLPLPDNRKLSDKATLVSDNEKVGKATISKTGDKSSVRIQSSKLGDALLTFTDGGQDYYYTLYVCDDGYGKPTARLEAIPMN
ncbi:MAG: hypothetical protein II629_06645 [Ruminococcus sp.]|nr:hypothetical protein [Ruminococcus sp.]